MVTPQTSIGSAALTPPAVTTRAEDAALLRRLRAGDEAAFELLVRQHAGPLLGVARRLLRNEDAARDAVQEAFVSAFRSIAAFREDAALATWLHRIVVNAALMRLRRDRRRAEMPIEDLLPRFTAGGRHADAVGAWPATAESLMLHEESRALVRAAIDALPIAYRTVLLLRDIEERSTQEVAGLLKISGNAVKLRLHRARLALAAMLGGRSPDAAARA